MFGLKDPESHKLYRKTTALDVNDETFAKALADVARCNHAPEEHEQIKGQVKVEGKWRKRSEMASAWTAKLANHVLKSAEAAIYKEETEDEDVLVSPRRHRPRGQLRKRHLIGKTWTRSIDVGRFQSKQKEQS